MLSKQLKSYGEAFAKRGALRLAAAVFGGLACASSSSLAVAQVANNPSVQVICEVNGATARTVRVVYPSAPVRKDHVFTPTTGGAPLVIHAPASATQVYNLVVPAGSYKMKHAVVPHHPGPGAVLTYGPVIVVPPFKIVGRMCERSQVIGKPSS